MRNSVILLMMLALSSPFCAGAANEKEDNPFARYLPNRADDPAAWLPGDPVAKEDCQKLVDSMTAWEGHEREAAVSSICEARSELNREVSRYHGALRKLSDAYKSDPRVKPAVQSARGVLDAHIGKCVDFKGGFELRHNIGIFFADYQVLGACLTETSALVETQIAKATQKK